jgi:phosphatidylglycerol:prolipoprotein diacylglycerol transferase
MPLPLTLPVIPFPAIDPVLIEIGPFAVRWYALAYIAGLVLGWWQMVRMARAPGAAVSDRQVDDFLLWATLGVVLGGRLGYVLFYKPGYYLGHPVEALYVWQGGMSFHGGLIGVVAAILLFARQRGIRPLALSDMIACVAPIGLFFGRIANFINGELWGRPGDVPWAMVFPGAGPEPRHPSQLYEAALEGLVLYLLLNGLHRLTPVAAREGMLTGIFLAGYALARITGEFFRQPDAHLGFLFVGATMGQLLSLPVLAAGLWLMRRARAAAR